MNIKLRKLGFMSFLSMCSTNACIWQYNRYHQSVKRWAIVNDQINNYSPQKLEDIIEVEKEIDDWNYRLIQLEGKLEGQYEYINRSRDSRLGYLLFRKFYYQTQGQKKGIYVCLGWIPKDHQMDEPKETKISLVGMVQKPEVKENTPQYTEGVYSFVNLLQMVQEQNFSTKTYLLKFDNNRDEQDLYPVPHTKETFEQPFLTPDRHRDYGIFWGSCTFVGAYHIIKILLS